MSLEMKQYPQTERHQYNQTPHINPSYHGTHLPPHTYNQYPQSSTYQNRPPPNQSRSFNPAPSQTPNPRSSPSAHEKLRSISLAPYTKASLLSHSNKISNQTYGFPLFLPLFLFNQFRYFFNLFFLLLCLSQLVPSLQIGFTFTYFGPLLFVLILSFFNEFSDEIGRFNRDQEVNKKKVVRVAATWKKETAQAGELLVGQIVQVGDGEIAPADLVVIHAKDAKVGVKTDQIDGETDTKVRKPIDYFQDIIDKGIDPYSLRFELLVDQPNDLIHNFKGTLKVFDEEGQVISTHGVDLHNTIWAYSSVSHGIMLGIVIYTGSQTKLMMSKSKGSPKRSLADDELNFSSKLLFIMMALGGLLLVWLKGFGDEWYIQLFRYILLLSTVVPISMKVNQDISKFFYSYRINEDRDIPGIVCRNSMIADDLGRLEYFLTDKTGTLTKNEMIMKGIGLGAETFDTTHQQVIISLLSRVASFVAFNPSIMQR